MGNGTARLKTLARQLWAGPQWYWRLLRVVVATWVLIVVLAMLFEERLIFFPTKYPGGDYDRAAEPPPDDGSYPKIEDVWLTASDGVRLHAWFAQAARRAGGKDEPVTPLATILYLHGNAGNLSHRYEKLLKLAKVDRLIRKREVHVRVPGGRWLLVAPAIVADVLVWQKLGPATAITLGVALALALIGRGRRPDPAELARLRDQVVEAGRGGWRSRRA